MQNPKEKRAYALPEYFPSLVEIIIFSPSLINNGTFIFFTFNMKILAFLWILLLIVIVIYMIYKFFKVNKLAAYLQIPYLIWLLFASILNLLEIL